MAPEPLRDTAAPAGVGVGRAGPPVETGLPRAAFLASCGSGPPEPVPPVETTPVASAGASVCPEGSGQGQRGLRLGKAGRVAFTLLRGAVSAPALCPGPHQHSLEEPWLAALALKPETMPKAGRPGLHGDWAPVQGRGEPAGPGPGGGALERSPGHWGWAPEPAPRPLPHARRCPGLSRLPWVPAEEAAPRPSRGRALGVDGGGPRGSSGGPLGSSAG